MSKYNLVGIDGNAFSIMSYVMSCMKTESVPKSEIEEYQSKAISGDYNNLLCISQDVIDELNLKSE